MLDVGTTLSGHDENVARARQFCTDQLTGALQPYAADWVDDIKIIVSELVTNAVNAHADHIDLTLRLTAHLLRICVTDDAPGTVTRGAAESDALHGRGLFIVAALASAWGVQPLSVGKQVWAELILP